MVKHKAWCRVILTILAVSSASIAHVAARIPLKVIHTEPANGDTTVLSDAVIKAYLGKKADPDTINPFSVTVSDGSSDIAGQVLYDAFENEISFVPATPLLENTGYRVIISKAVKDLNGHPLAEKKEWVFTTRGRDVIRPVVTYASPVPESINVYVSTAVRVVFSEPIDEDTLSEDTLIVTSKKGEVIGDLMYDEETRTLTYVPEAELDFETKYHVTLMEWIKDVSGNNLASRVEWNFTTIDPPDKKPPEVVEVQPPPKSRDLSVTQEISVVFNEIVLSADLNVFTFTLRDGDMTVPGRIKYDYKEKKVWYVPDGHLMYGRLYTAEVKKGLRDLSNNKMEEGVKWSFTTIPPPDVEPPFVFNFEPPDGGRNVPVDTELKAFVSEDLDLSTLNESNVQLYLDDHIIPGKTTFVELEKRLYFKPHEPLEHGKKYLFILRRGITDVRGNRLRDEAGILFQTEPPPDIYPPRVVAASPVVGATDVPLDATIDVIFDEEIQKATLNLFTFTVSEEETNVYGAIEYQRGEKKGTFKPKETLTHGTLYNVKIFNIKDIAGNRMEETFVWSFMTIPAPDITAPTVESTSPEDGADNFLATDPIKVKFSEAIKPDSINEFTFLLSDGLENIVGIVSYDEFKHEAAFEQKNPLIPGKIYWAHLSHFIQDKAGNEMTEDMVWKFSTIPPEDTVSPKVLRFSPGQKEVNVDVTENIAVFFDEPIDARSLNPFTFRITQGRKVISGKIIYFDENYCATFTSDTRLDFGKEYVVEVGKGVLDMRGNPLEAATRWVFRTINRDKVAGMDIQAAYSYFETNPFPDIPRNHWAFNAIKELARRGYLSGHDGSKFNGGSGASRYEIAMVANRIIENSRLREKVDLYEVLLIEKLVTEFSPELNVLGARISDYRDRISRLGLEVQKVKQEVSQLKRHVARYKEAVKKGLATHKGKMMMLAMMALAL